MPIQKISPGVTNAETAATYINQAIDLAEQLEQNKVDKVADKDLSTNNYSDADKNKLAGVSAGATANASDAELRDRSTHTGEQPIASVTGLQQALDGKLSKTGDTLTSLDLTTHAGTDTDTEINWLTAMFFTRDMAAPATFTFSNLPAKAAERTLFIKGGNSQAPTLPVSWVGGSEPAWTNWDMVRLFKLPDDETVFADYRGSLPLPTATYNIWSNTVAYSGYSADISAQVSGNAYGLFFSADGTKMYTTTYTGGVNALVLQYTLNTPGTLAGGVTYDGSLDVFGYTGEWGTLYSPKDLALSADGTKLFVYDQSVGSLFQFTLNSTVDITAGIATFDGYFFVNETVVGWGASWDGFCFSGDGTKVLFSGVGPDQAAQWTLAGAYDIVTAPPTGDGVGDISVLSHPYDIVMSPSGATIICVQGGSSKGVAQFTLTVPGNVTGGLTYDGFKTASESGRIPVALHFNGTGSKFWTLTNTDPDTIYEYDVT